MKNILFLLLLIFSLHVKAQDDSRSDISSKTFVTELHFTTNSIEELQDVNWEDVRQIFGENEPDSEIELGFTLSEKQVLSHFDLDAFQFRLSGKTDELESMILRAQKMIGALLELN